MPWKAIAYIRVRRGWLSVRLVTTKGCVGQYEDAAIVAVDPGEKRVESFGSQALEQAQMPMRELHRLFDHPRLFVHDYELTRLLLVQFLRRAGIRRFRAHLHCVIWHPLNELAGGITDVELRALFQLAASFAGNALIGCPASVVWRGGELSDADALRMGFASDEAKWRITCHAQSNAEGKPPLLEI